MSMVKVPVLDTVLLADTFKFKFKKIGFESHSDVFVCYHPLLQMVHAISSGAVLQAERVFLIQIP